MLFVRFVSSMVSGTGGCRGGELRRRQQAREEAGGEDSGAAGEAAQAHEAGACSGRQQPS